MAVSILTLREHFFRAGNRANVGKIQAQTVSHKMQAKTTLGFMPEAAHAYGTTNAATPNDRSGRNNWRLRKYLGDSTFPISIGEAFIGSLSSSAMLHFRRLLWAGNYNFRSQK